MSAPQDHYINLLRKLRNMELHIELRAAEERAEAKYHYCREIRKLNISSVCGCIPVAQRLHHVQTDGRSAPIWQVQVSGAASVVVAADVPECHVHPPDHARLERARHKYKQRCADVEVRRLEELKRVQRSRETVLKSLESESAARMC